MLLARIVQTSAEVAATRSRLEKRRLLAEALVDAQDPAEAELAASFLSGRLRQRRTGLGWRSLEHLPAPAPTPALGLLDVDSAMEAVSRLSGAGSRLARDRAVADLFGLATAEEQQFLRRLAIGELRQGALDALLLEAVAQAADVPVTAVRRAAMFSAFSGPVAAAALGGGEAALADFRLEVLRPIRPMLASPAPDVDAALAELCAGAAPKGKEVAVDAKLDGVRIQVHRSGQEVVVYTRSLDDITERVPEVVRRVRDLDVRSVVLDGEALLVDAEGRPRPFQETGSRAASHDSTDHVRAAPLTSYFFDLLHLDGRDLVDVPAAERFDLLASALPAPLVVPRLVTEDPAQVHEFFAAMLERGHEGVVVKDLAAPYAAGRRGAAWLKVKPRHTLDLVVLAVEWGSGRRRGLLSNIHLGARDGDGFVMLGKTFKGMTDEMLRWQTERFLSLETGRRGNVVELRPEQVVEVAFDGVQRSSRYPGGVALRFARVLRYRDDKTAAEADTLDDVRSLAPR